MTTQDPPQQTASELIDPSTEREQHLVSTRSELLPEEQAAGGSADPQAQAAVILADSQERTEVPNAAPTTHLERRGPTDGA
jgi:hypothetical protein